jgi:hypothetical protein
MVVLGIVTFVGLHSSGAEVSGWPPHRCRVSATLESMADTSIFNSFNNTF